MAEGKSEGREKTKKEINTQKLTSFIVQEKLQQTKTKQNKIKNMSFKNQYISHLT